jgi:hypothetical protein
MARLFLVLSVAALAVSGCASYGDVAKLNRTNQDYLARLDKQLSSDTAKSVYAKLGSSRAATLRAQSRAGLASIEAKSRSSDVSAQQTYLNAELARIQTQFNAEADDDAGRAALLRALDGKLADAAKALHENGKDIQRYLDLGVLQRLFTDVRGMDTTKLKQIGEDLKSISEQLVPGVGRFSDGVVKP